MTSDIRVQQARQHQRDALGADGSARRHREQRDRLLRQVYAEGEVTLEQLAHQVGMTKAAVAKVITPQIR